MLGGHAGKRIMGIIDIHPHAQAELFLVVDTGGLPGATLGRGQDGQKQSRQDADDGDDDQEFNERESTLPFAINALRVAGLIGAVPIHARI
jgi:hypothetical protein